MSGEPTYRVWFQPGERWFRITRHFEAPPRPQDYPMVSAEGLTKREAEEFVDFHAYNRSEYYRIEAEPPGTPTDHDSTDQKERQ